MEIQYFLYSMDVPAPIDSCCRDGIFLVITIYQHVTLTSHQLACVMQWHIIGITYRAKTIYHIINRLQTSEEQHYKQQLASHRIVDNKTNRYEYSARHIQF